MKKILTIVMLALMLALMFASIGFVSAAGGSITIPGTIGVEDFRPIVWECGDRVLLDEEVQPWRVSNASQNIVERTQNYIFDGETYQVDVVVFDKGKIEDVQTDLTLSQDGQTVNYTLNCIPTTQIQHFAKCNAKIGEEVITTYDASKMKSYKCSIVIPDSEHMYGQYYMSVRAKRGTQSSSLNEFTQWFINPIISVTLDGSLNFGSNIRPGTSAFSPTVQVKNVGDGGVLLDMFIVGRDWQPTGTNLGRCWDKDLGTYVNYLPLSSFRYKAVNGAWSTSTDAQIDKGYSSVKRNRDAAGYVNINRLINAGFEEKMFDDAEIIQAGTPVISGKGYSANVITQGSTGMALTFRLDLPEPCYGSFASSSTGGFVIYGEAI